MVPVFRNGSWSSYPVPKGSGWTPQQTLRAASVYATALTKGHPPHLCSVLAECALNKELYGVTYGPTIEAHLKEFQV